MIRDTELFHEKKIPGQLSLGNIINSILSLKSYNEHKQLNKTFFALINTELGKDPTSI